MAICARIQQNHQQYPWEPVFSTCFHDRGPQDNSQGVHLHVLCLYFTYDMLTLIFAWHRSTSNVHPSLKCNLYTLKVREKPTSLRAAWELLEIFYVDKQLQSWLPERLVDWLAVMLFPKLFPCSNCNILTLPRDDSCIILPVIYRILTASCQQRRARCILNSAISRKSSSTCRLAYE